MQRSADPTLTQRILSVSEAAKQLQVNPARVRAMIAAGILDSAKVGGRWVVSARSVAKRGQTRARPGRRLSPRRAWGLLRLASGMRPDWLHPSEVSRLRSRLRDSGLESLAPRLQSRAVIHRLRAHPSDLARIAEEDEVVRAGISALSHHAVDLSPPADLLEVYVPTRVLPHLAKTYALEPSPRPNLILRAVDGVWPFADGTTFAPAVVVGLDLLDADDARLRRVGQELLRRPK